MARAALVDQYVQYVHEHVSRQVGRLLATTAPSADGLKMKSLVESGAQSKSGLATCFDVWSLTLNGVFAEGRELRDVARNDHRWHHQLISNGKAVGFARSNSATGTDYGALTELFEADIAESIERAVTLIDREQPDSEAEVRVLLVPALRVTALWLCVENDPTADQCIVVAGLGREARLRPRLTSAHNFIARLRKVPHAREMRRPEH